MFEVDRNRDRITVFHPESREVAWSAWNKVVVRRLTWREDPPILVRQTSPIRALDVSPDESLLAWAGEDLKIHVARDRGKRDLAEFSGHTLAILSLHFVSGSAGLKLVSTSADGTVRLWDVDRPEASPQVLSPPGGQATVLDAIAADHGRVVVTAEYDGGLRFWDTDSERVKHVDRAHDGPARALALSPDGLTLASVGGDGMLAIWDPREGQRVRGPWKLAGPAGRVCFSPDGTRLAVAGTVERAYRDSMLKADDLHAQVVELDRQGADEVYVAIVNASRGTLVRRWSPRSPVNALTFSPDGGRVITAGAERDLVVWDPETGRQTIALAGHSQPALGLVAIPGTLRVYSAGLDGTIRLWEGLNP